MIFFDLDDTLLDSHSASLNAAINLYKDASISMSLQEFLASWQAAQERQYSRYDAKEISFQEQRRARLREVINPALSDCAADQMFTHYQQSLESHWHLFDDVLPCFERLYGHRLGLISNGDAALQRRKLAKTGISDMFNCVVISSECGCAKPDEEIFLRACALAGVTPKNAVYIGDRYDLDAEGARKAGLLHGFWLNRRNASAHKRTQPIISSLNELIFPEA
ncbi:HAD family hydrolase [Rhodomicrobium vannielii]|uniref:HAD family hydrolase n=1 Tax=Rhodomicrobium vannielii TaxID=1069 RepID=UPI001919FFF7|nr:HAD family hydrolase [Rhodomicrobium vannielii]